MASDRFIVDDRCAASDKRLRVGAVNYLNTIPLVYGLENEAETIDLRFDLPSRLADVLAAAQYDIALIPSIELFQDPTYQVVSSACIACRGPVLSVKLLSRVPMDQIRTLALDEGSRTSVALVRILLAARFGLSPQTESLPIGASVDDTTADAVLLIGDRAMHSPQGKFVDIWDLGDEWYRWSELPFVFAMWTARPGIDTRTVEPLLNAARDEGVQHFEEIAARAAAPQGLTRPQCLSYLRDNLHFQFGPQERRGLELFHQHAVRLGLVPSGWESRKSIPNIIVSS